MHHSWGLEEVDTRLEEIMATIFHNVYQTSEEFGHKGDLVTGANIVDFLKVAETMGWQGVAY